MINETDSSSQSSPTSPEQVRSHKKLHKELKTKAQKKYKKEKKSKKARKRSHKDIKKDLNDEDDIQLKKPLSSQTKYDQNVYERVEDTFGPALPPHLLNKNKTGVKKERLVIGPTIPKELQEHIEKSDSDKNLSEELHKYSETVCDDNLQGSYGPLPVTNEIEMTQSQLELEQRALELKMTALDGTIPQTNNQNIREEWMLELPDVGLKGGLQALNNLKRTFHQGKEKPDFRDRSSWTKTPNSSQEKHKPTSSKDVFSQVKALQEKHRDAEQEAIAKEHKKKHRREESLVEIHQKKLRKEEKKKLKALKKSSSKPERRPFTRDIDLKLNTIDRNQTKQIVDKAKILNTKFSSGHSKYL